MIRRRKPINEPKSINHVDAILCADLHVRADIPLCRIDNFQEAMFGKLSFIFDLCRRYNVPLLCGGDIGHRSQWPNWLIEKFMALAEGVKIISALGQHDLPGHNLSELNRSACGVLQRAGVVKFDNVLMGNKYIITSHFGEDLPVWDVAEKNILLTHRMVIEGVQDWPGQIADKGHALLKQLPFCQLILSGDNHQSFVVRHDNRLLVNPGAMMRTTVTQADFKPRVYLWDATANEVSPVFLPIEEGVVNRDHIDMAAARDDRMKAFIERVKMDYADGVDFVDELQKYFVLNRTWDKTKQKVYHACEMETI